MDEMDNRKNEIKEDTDQTFQNNEYKKLLNPKITPIKAAFLGLAGGFFLYQIVGGFLSLTIFGFDLKNIDFNAFRLMTIAGQILFILLPALIFAKLIYTDVTEIIRFRKTTLIEIGLFLIGIIALTPLLQNFLFIQNYYFEELAKSSSLINGLKSSFDSLNKVVEDTYGDLLKINNIFDGVIVVSAISIFPAICEEAMFRGFIQRSFELKYKPFFAALITAVFFGIYHFNPYAVFALIALGLYFGYAAYKSNSIIIPVILHFVNNFSAIILYIIFGDEELNQNRTIPKGELTSVFYNFGYLLIIFIVIMVIIWKFYDKKKKLSSEK